MKDLRDLKDLTMHDVKSITELNATPLMVCPHHERRGRRQTARQYSSGGSENTKHKTETGNAFETGGGISVLHQASCLMERSRPETV